MKSDYVLTGNIVCAFVMLILLANLSLKGSVIEGVNYLLAASALIFNILTILSYIYNRFKKA